MDSTSVSFLDLVLRPLLTLTYVGRLVPFSENVC